MSAFSLPARLTRDRVPDLSRYVSLIDEANIYDVARKTDLARAPRLSDAIGQPVYLKLEFMQDVSSFKIRGAAYAVSHLNESERRAGIVTASAGNHAQGVALAAAKLGVCATIVMPKTTPQVKIDAVRYYGADVVLVGDAFPEALAFAQDLKMRRGMTFVHPFDDDYVIAGQGTVGKEILAQASGPIEAIFVPVGGGGLISGIAAYVKFHHPDIKIIGVEPLDSDCLHQALLADARITLSQVGLFADGVAVAQIGERPFEIARHYVDETIQVSADEICAAAVDICDDTRRFPEPAGAVAVAGLRKYANRRDRNDGAALVAVVSGANVDTRRMQNMLERALIVRKQEMLMAVTLPERPGALREFCSLLKGINITEFNYRYANENEGHIFIGVNVQDYAKDSDAILTKLSDYGIRALDVTDNELAKEHIRHMVGGRPSKLLNEDVYSFEFPERPGALLSFLTQLDPTWSISLFHYRSHGASHGRVLMGLVVPQCEHGKLEEFVANSDYRGRVETHNPMYDFFLEHRPSTSYMPGRPLAAATL